MSRAQDRRTGNGLVVSINLGSNPGTRVQAHTKHGVTLILDEWFVPVPDRNEPKKTYQKRRSVFLREEDYCYLRYRKELTRPGVDADGSEITLIHCRFERDDKLVINVSAHHNREALEFVFDAMGLQELEAAFDDASKWHKYRPFVEAKSGTPSQT